MISLSFSRLATFEQCQQKFDYMYVSKSVQDKPTVHTEYGTRVHEKLELYGRGTLPAEEFAADPEAGKYKGLLDRVLSAPGEKLFEQQMSIRRDKTPCGWFDKDVWIRGIADVLVLNGDDAIILDWKTGKPKENPTQLQLFAALVFEHYPAVQRVKSAFLWLKTGTLDDMTYKRAHLKHIWSALEPRFDKVQEVVDLGVYKAKPGPLCNWCAAKPICGDAR